MNKTTESYNKRDFLVKKEELENKNRELQKQIKENEKDIEAIDRVLSLVSTKSPVSLKKRTNYDIVEEILRENGKPMQIKELHLEFIARGGKTLRPSFDASLGKWLKQSSKKITRKGMGLYKYTA